jgi:RNA polymerase sigma-70 factor (ECF subfamily)
VFAQRSSEKDLREKKCSARSSPEQAMPVSSAARGAAPALEVSSAGGHADRKEPSPALATPIPEALAAAVMPHRDALYTRALRLSGNRERARDLVQDTIERALRRRESFVSGTNLRAWLMTILTNRFLDLVRRDKLAAEVAIDDHDVAAEPLPEARVSPERLRAAVAALPDDLREVVTLHALDGRGYRDIAEQLGIPIGTVGTRLARARSRLLLELREETP